MTGRVCANCGLPEERKQDSQGRDVVNLDPVSSLCVPCLVKATPRRLAAERALPADYKNAAAGEREDRE